MGLRLPRRSSFAWGLVALACYAPTLPLPPPGEPTAEALAGTDRYRLRGFVEPRSLALALNKRTATAVGEQAGSDGAYDFEVEGEPDDQIHFWYVVGQEQSPATIFLLPRPAPPEGGAAGDGGAAGAGPGG